MAVLSSAALLTLWEQGAALHPIDRALALCKAARTDLQPAQLADLPLGEVNTALLDLRRRSFGSCVAAQVDCERCSIRLEISLDVDAILSELEANTASERGDVSQAALRAPTLGDLAGIASAADVESAMQMLLERCGSEAPGAVLLSVPEAERRLEALDPAADIALALHCEECGHQWRASLDVAALLWTEIAAGASQLLDEVHRLATAYGWAERDILALSAQRRAAYLELCAA